MPTPLRNVRVTIQAPHIPPNEVLDGPDGELHVLHGVRHVSVFLPFNRRHGGPSNLYSYRITAVNALDRTEIDVPQIDFIGYAPYTGAARFADQLVGDLEDSTEANNPLDEE